MPIGLAISVDIVVLVVASVTCAITIAIRLIGVEELVTIITRVPDTVPI